MRNLDRSYGTGFRSTIRICLNQLLISKGLPSIARDFHELFVFICKEGISFYSKGFPSIVRDFLLQQGTSFYVKE